MKRWRSSLGKPHPKRQPVLNDTKRAEFREVMSEVLSTTPPWLILNRDERSRKPLNQSILTVADRGEEGIFCVFNRDSKACVTTITTLDAAGGRLDDRERKD
jgi:hypothetical protein